MYKTTIKAQGDKIEITIPKEYMNRELEIFIHRKQPGERKDIATFFGVMEEKNLDEEIKNLREEWNREI